jgi:hypothetical protein
LQNTFRRRLEKPGAQRGTGPSHASPPARPLFSNLFSDAGITKHRKGKSMLRRSMFFCAEMANSVRHRDLFRDMPLIIGRNLQIDLSAGREAVEPEN